MIKKILFVVIFISLVFTFGIFLENKLKNELSRINFDNKKEVVEKIQIVNNREIATVKRVVDGDTIELSDNRIVRYIGINTFEMNDKRKDMLCFAKMAKIENEKLVLGKNIEMEKDISEMDKYGRLLRYVWINGEMVNLLLVKNGFAKTATYPPDIKYKDLFLEAENTALKITCSTI
jgi:micrococcal nuclease